jgi:hypothetical protein
VNDIQRCDGRTVFFPRIGAVSDYQIAWSIVRNRGVYVGGLLGTKVGWGFNLTTFLDPSRAPLGKARPRPKGREGASAIVIREDAVVRRFVNSLRRDRS